MKRDSGTSERGQTNCYLLSYSVFLHETIKFQSKRPSWLGSVRELTMKCKIFVLVLSLICALDCLCNSEKLFVTIIMHIEMNVKTALVQKFNLDGATMHYLQ